MLALALGGIAALSWGVHDLLVRRMSQLADTAACMLVVLTTGCICLTVLGLFTGAMPSSDDLPLQLASGVAFAVATYCMWQALAVGSVRLVVPVIASYPVISLLLATLSGESILIVQWLLVLTVIAGVSIVARGESSRQSRKVLVPVCWAAGSAVGFAITFWTGQLAMGDNNTVSVLVMTRLVAVASTIIFMLFIGGLRWPVRRDIPILCLMGLCDTVALASVLFAGNLPGGTFAMVTASLFGVITIILAWVFLKERLAPLQWVGLAVTFTAIGAIALV